MEIKIDRREDNYGLISIALNAADYKADFEKYLKNHQKRAQLKGFRPGMVPMNLLRKMVGKELKADVISEKINKEVANYIKEEQLHVLFFPMQKNEPLSVYEIEAKDDFVFEFEVCLEPNMTVDLGKVQLEKFTISSSDADIDEVISRLKQRIPSVVPAETIAKGDFVKGIFAGGNDIVETSTLPTDQISEASWSAFEGKQVGDIISFDIREALPEDSQIRSLFAVSGDAVDAFAGEFTLAVEEITRNADAEMNQEFFDKALGAGRVTSEEEFRDALREEINKGNQGQADELLKTDVRRAVIEGFPFELPEELMIKVLKASQGEKGVTDEYIQENLAGFVLAAKWQAFSTKLFREAGMSVSSHEIHEAAKGRIMAQFQSYGFRLPEDQMEELAESLLHGKEEKERLREAEQWLVNEKIAGFIIDNANVTEKTLTLAEFEQIVLAREESAVPTLE